ncbi:MAG: hypothetical protein FWD21_00655 [Peptococcaceae bacterium]|nr:hypothetical protein [Peptococcaceae bacterium]
MKQQVYAIGNGPCRVEMTVTLTGNGLVVQIYGGDGPHVGALALSQPRPSRTGNNKTSCSTSVLTLLGHKEDEVAKPAAEKIAKAINQPVVVVAGLHVDHAGTNTITELVDNCQQVVQMFINEYEAN